MADFEQMSLDNVLSGEKPAAPAAPSEPAAAPETTQTVEAPAQQTNTPAQSTRKAHQQRERDAREDGAGRVRDPETGQYVAKPKEAEPAPSKVAAKVEKAATATPSTPPEAPKVESTAAAATPVPPPAQQQLTPQERAFLAAAQDERNKRQELERRIAAMEAAAPKQPEKNFWDDPEAALKQTQAQIQQAVVNTRLNTSEMIARAAHPDFDEKVAVFAEIVQSAPHIAQHVLNQASPAEAVYAIAKNHMALRDAGGVEQLLAKREAEVSARVRAEVEAELREKDAEVARLRDTLPGSLTNARGTSVQRKVWNGPTSLDDILGK